MGKSASPSANSSSDPAPTTGKSGSFFVQVAKGGDGGRCSLNLVQKEQAPGLLESPVTAHEFELPQDELDVAGSEHAVEPRMPFEIDLVKHELLRGAELPDESGFSDPTGAPNQKRLSRPVAQPAN